MQQQQASTCNNKHKHKQHAMFETRGFFWRGGESHTRSIRFIQFNVFLLRILSNLVDPNVQAVEKKRDNGKKQSFLQPLVFLSLSLSLSSLLVPEKKKKKKKKKTFPSPLEYLDPPKPPPN